MNLNVWNDARSIILFAGRPETGDAVPARRKRENLRGQLAVLFWQSEDCIFQGLSHETLTRWGREGAISKWANVDSPVHQCQFNYGKVL